VRIEAVERGDLTIVSWNLHSSARPDLDAVAALLRTMQSDVVALQEVQRRQAFSIAQRLGWSNVRWSFKHWPVAKAAEGLAVLSRGDVETARAVVLSTGAPPWSYRRRTAQLVRLVAEGSPIELANVHLASDSAADGITQVCRLLAELPASTIIAGDRNDDPKSEVVQQLTRAGWRDAWDEVNADGGATAWADGAPDGPPSERLDYVLVPPALGVSAAAVPSRDFDGYGPLSDHLPLAVRLRFEP
jgi:endonuclease/exonuclease/phosphatase family metal-dependent hydrolase